MKRIVYLFVVINTLLFLSGCNTLNASPEQSYIIYIEGNSFKVRTDITGEVVFSSGDASTSIQWAIDNLGSGSINAGDVLIEAGSYPLSNCIIVKDNVWLHGEGNLTELYTDGQLMECIIIQDASMAIVSDLKLVNKNNKLRNAEGILIERSVNCQVLDVEVSGFRRGIVNTGESSMTLINNNHLSENGTNIRIMNGGGVIGRWIPLLVTENTINSGKVGIECKAMVVHIIDNIITGVSGNGIVAGANSIVLRGNKLSNIGGEFAIYGDKAEFNCTDNIITNVKGGGIRTRTRWGNFTNNQIINCGTKDKPAIGILVINDNAMEGPAESKTFFKNRIINESGQTPYECGIKEDGFFNVIMENTIENAQEPIISTGEGTLVKNNIISAK